MTDQPAPAEAVIRTAKADDLPQIQAIYAHYVTAGVSTFEIDPPDLAEMTRRFEALTGGGYPYIVAEAGGAVGGYAYAGPYRTRPAYRHTVEDSVYVAPGHVGLGLGRRLVEEIIRRSAEAGFRQMVAVISDDESTVSIHLHARCGFEHVGVLKNVGYKMGRWIDSTLMQRPLGEGNRAEPTR